MRKNLNDLINISWSDGEEGYDPINLNIERFGLNYDFIVANKLSWIDNLITASGKDLADPSHKLPYRATSHIHQMLGEIVVLVIDYPKNI